MVRTRPLRGLTLHTGDLFWFIACLQEVTDLLLADIDRWPDIFDLERAPETPSSTSSCATSATRSRSSAILRIDAGRIVDWDSFHDVFAEILGFPDFYGRNMNAWIDCMTCLDDPEAGMTNVHAPPGGVMTLLLDDVSGFATRCPAQYEALVECAAFVNWRRLEKGEPSVLTLAFNE
ncbi:MAG: barstar family protein [Myxococcaceae bacterium]|nr:barstar family protein [Myxococcaceae bacterium]